MRPLAFLRLSFVLLCLFAFFAGGCSRSSSRAPAVSPLPPPHVDVDPFVSPLQAAGLPAPVAPDASQVGLAFQSVKYFSEITESLQLNGPELELLAQNGFVVSDNHAWGRFVEAYGWIYWQDLPVIVTTDSILHAVHVSYDDLLKSLESGYIVPQLERFLSGTLARLSEAAAANADPMLADAYADVQVYVDVALALLRGQSGVGPRVQSYVTLATAANGVNSVDLFGTERYVDFTQFKPRGHYADSDLANYFRAMMWLALVDFRFTETDPLTSEERLLPQMVVAATILQDAVDDAGQMARWQQIDSLLSELIGPSDNITLPTLRQFREDVAIQQPSDVLIGDENRLLDQLLNHDYGQQRITGQIVARHIGNESQAPVPRPNLFALFGQRFSIDSYILGNVVYDRLFVDGQPVERALPSTLDLMVALGNDHALTHLDDELETYGYAGTLAALRQTVDEQPPVFWQRPLLNQWLGMIRTLDTPTVDGRFPRSMRTAAWADKMLQTQLASWAQFRHDNLLYVKQSYTTFMILCEYPAGYVEPYPAFYAGLHDFAQTGYELLDALAPTTNSLSEVETLGRARVYFKNVMEIASQLETMAEKELDQIPFTPEEELFLRSIMVKQNVNIAGCGGPTFEEMWDGWYSHLFFRRDDKPTLIADVHTNPNNDPSSALYPPSVLHAATGPVAAMLFIVDTDEGEQLYVGPAFSYFEVVEEGFPPERLSDEEWRQRLEAEPYPSAPAWTASFRVPADRPPEPLDLPGRPKDLLSR